MNCSLLGRIPLIRVPLASVGEWHRASRRRARSALQPCAVRSRFQASQLVTSSTASSLSGRARGRVSSSCRRSNSSARARLRAIVGESCTVEQRSRGAPARSPRTRRPAGRRAPRRSSPADQRRVPLPLPLRDLAAQRLDVGEVVVHRTHRHAGPGRDLGHARARARPPRSRRCSASMIASRLRAPRVTRPSSDRHAAECDISCRVLQLFSDK